MKIAICDDELSQINQIEGYMENLKRTTYPKIIYESFVCGNELIKQYEYDEKPYDIIFLDMEIGILNGIETAKKIRFLDDKVIIIFVTGYKDYVYDCFEVNPFRFIVKPINYDIFTNVLNAAYQIFLNKSKPFYFNTGSTINKVYYDEILYFESNKRKVIIHAKNNNYEFYAKLNILYDTLKEFGFLYIHKSYIVNMEYIRNINYESLTLLNDITLPISESKRKTVRREHLNFLERNYIYG